MRSTRSREVVLLALCAGLFVLALLGPWMLTTLVEYLREMMQAIPGAVG